MRVVLVALAALVVLVLNLYALTNLIKLYIDNIKFIGDLYNVLNIKLNIFYNLYTKARITKDKYNVAFSTILYSKI